MRKPDHRRSAWGVLPETLQLISAWLQGQVTDEEIKAAIGAPRAQRDEGVPTVGGVAILPLQGLITPQGSLLSLILGAGGGLQGFRSSLKEALADDSVGSILVNIDSPGGIVDLVPEVAAELRAAREQKPITAVANTMAASAAYWLAAQADEIVVTPSGQVGSIGVFAEHDDLSGALEQRGISVTLVSAGKYKTDGNPYEPLSDSAKADMQAMVDYYYGLFTADVAKGRKTTQAAVKGGYGEGRLVNADEAVSLGLADRVGTIEDTIAGMAGRGTRRNAVALALGKAVEHASIEDVRKAFELLAQNGDPFPSDRNADPDSDADDPDEDEPGDEAEDKRENDEARAGLNAKAIPGHNTDVVDVPWDGPGQEKKLKTPIAGSVAKGMYAWYDSTAADADGDGWPDAKSAYKFPHHQVDSDGNPGAANVNGVRAALSRLGQNPNIPDSDKPGVRAHLQHHLDAFNRQKGEASSEQNEASPARRVADVLIG